MEFQNILSVLNLLVVALTGFVVWLYTKAAQRSNEIQEQPLLNFYFKEISNPGGASLGNISIKNIGKGPAYSIFFEPIELEGYRYRFYLENPMLESLEEKEPRAVVRTPKGGTEAFNRDSMWFLHRLIPQTLTNDAVNYALQNPAIFLAHYQGSNGVMYYSVFALYCNLPPTGDILMQFIIHGRGEFSVDEAKKAWSLAKKIRSPFER